MCAFCGINSEAGTKRYSERCNGSQLVRLASAARGYEMYDFTELETNKPRSALAKTVLASAAVLAGTAVLSQVLANQAEKNNPPKGKFIEVDGVRLHYVEQGSGEPIVFIHGNGSMIEDLASSGLLSMAAQNGRAIAFDRPGFGHTDRPSGRSWGPEEQAALLVKAFAALKIDRPVIVAHSWGTLVALALALNHPNSVARLVLLSGYYFASLRSDTVMSAPGATPVLGDIFQHTVGPLIARLTASSVIEHMFEPRPVNPAFKAGYPVGLASRPSQLKAVATDTLTMPFNAFGLSRRYHELKLPVAIFAGENDKIVDSAAQSGKLHEAIPHSSYHCEKNTGHMIHHAIPAAIIAAALD